MLVLFIQPQYLVFKELFLRNLHDLSKPSKTIIRIASIFFLELLLRKEVIHPHVPVGIPCYDFTPVADPTLIGPLPCRLGYHLRVLPTPMA